MQAEQLIIEHMDLWTAAIKQRSTAGRGSSNNVGLYGIKKLRELILELAMRGQLVPQDPNNEPASELLRKIDAERVKLMKEGKLKKEKPLPPIAKLDKPFDLPNGWEWAVLPQICDYGPGKTPSTKNSMYWEEAQTGIPWVSISDMEHLKTLTQTAKRITSRAATDVFRCEPVPAGTMIMSFKLTLGKISKLGVDAYHNEAIIALHPYSEVCKEYVFNFLPSRAAAGNLKAAIKGNTLNSESLATLLIPIPPAKEQHRIVAKVNELMALCDQLEQQTEANLSAHQTLVETLLNALVSATDHAQLFTNWQLVAKHFDTLFTTEKSVDQLKQTTLQLAMMGKLVPQDPNDDPACELLKKIAAKKAVLVKEGKIKKEKQLSPVAEEEAFFELPASWVWTRFGSIVSFESELVDPEGFQDFDQVAPDSIEKGTGKLLFRRTVAQSGVLGPNNKFYAGQILYSKIRPSLSKAIVAEFDGLCSADIYPLGVIGLSTHFLLKLILSEQFLTQVRREENRIKMPKLNIPSLSSFVVAVPPLAEQLRIVAKIDELMALCDQLKGRLNDARSTQVLMADATADQVFAEA